MFFLMYLSLSGMVWFLGLVVARRQVVTYSARSALFSLSGLVLFILFSSWAGIMPVSLGEGVLISYSVSFPYAYLNRGLVGIAVLCVGVMGILSPALAAWLCGRASASPHPVH
jgi:hypothetical protein